MIIFLALHFLCQPLSGDTQRQSAVATLPSIGEFINDIDVDSVNAHPNTYTTQAIRGLNMGINVESCVFLLSILRVKAAKKQIAKLVPEDGEILLLKNFYFYFTESTNANYRYLVEKINDSTIYSDNYNSVVLTMLSFDPHFYDLWERHENRDGVVGETFAESIPWLYLLLMKDKKKYDSYSRIIKGKTDRIKELKNAKISTKVEESFLNKILRDIK